MRAEESRSTFAGGTPASDDRVAVGGEGGRKPVYEEGFSALGPLRRRRRPASQKTPGLSLSAVPMPAAVVRCRPAANGGMPSGARNQATERRGPL
ncbi:hypothetical protein MTO96_001131 [Rhipicephalus appendiculatus]